MYYSLSMFTGRQRGENRTDGVEHHDPGFDTGTFQQNLATDDRR